jgi:Na+/proline symporter
MLSDLTPVLQIATAILLAVLILVFWRALLGLGALLAVIGVLLVLLGFYLWIGSDTLITDNENIGLWAAVIGFYGAVLAGLAGLNWHLVQRAKRKASSGST